VEDCVREMIRMGVEEFESFGPDAFLLARQENIETIHKHNVVAERYGLIGRIKSELDSDAHVTRHVTMRDWLEGAHR
jgi:GTP cyclohydrolase I/GTP cyclohydrolase-4